MSRVFSAKNRVLKIYPTKENLDDAIDLFLELCDCSEDDFVYEFDQTPEDYIYKK